MRNWLRNVVVVLAAGMLAAPTEAASSKGDDLFEQCVIPELKLEVSREALNSLSHSARKYVRATLREGKTTYTNVAIHLKGGPGSFRQLNDKPSFTLNFDKFAPGQRFHGLKKIHLNNSVQDRTFLHEKFSRELCNAAGVPAPRAGNAWVEFNGDELGMYVLLEGVNKQFLKRYFKDVTGNVYDGHSGNDVDQNMRTNSGENRSDKSRLKALANAAHESDLSDRLEALGKTLDIDRFLSFMAVELMLGHWDGYTVGRNNFRVYHDRDSDRMVFLTHGMDQVLGRKYGIFPQNAQGLTARSVLEIPELRQRYRARYAQIATNIFLAENFTNHIALAARQIQAMLEKHGSAENYERLGPALCRGIARRASYVRAQVEPVQFNGLGVVQLTNWLSKIDLGEAQVNMVKDDAGNGLLYIATKEGCTASWRTTEALPPGEYRFLAKIRTKGVVLSSDDPRAGAGLRVSRYRTGQKNAGDREWTPIFFDFSVGEKGNEGETELVCELRADEGEIWYDLKSLKIIRK